MNNIQSQGDASRYEELSGLPGDLSTPEVKIACDSLLEAAFVICGIIGIALTIGQVIEYSSLNVLFLLLSIMFSVSAFYLRSQTDCSYIISNEKKVILYRRSIMGTDTDTHLCSFSDVAFVAVSGGINISAKSRSWSYPIVLILKSGNIIPLTSGTPGYGALEASNYSGKQFADHLGAEFFPGEEEKGIRVDCDEKSGALEVTYIEHYGVSS